MRSSESGRLSNIFNNVKGGEAQLRARKAIEHEPILEALHRGDGSIVLRIELVDTQALGTLADLHGEVVNGVRIHINPSPKKR